MKNLKIFTENIDQKAKEQIDLRASQLLCEFAGELIDRIGGKK